MIMREIHAIAICMLLAFVLYELSGLIGKEMLADKHINGKGKGYCDIVFGKEQDKSLIVNMQYNVFAPLIYTLLIASVIQYLENEWLLSRIISIVPCYYIVRAIMITVVSGKKQLYNIKYEATTAILGCILAFIIQKTLILSQKNIMMTIEEFRTELWLIIFVLIYNFIIHTWGKSSKLKQNRICTNHMKYKYIFEKYNKFKKLYGNKISKITNDIYLTRVIYSIMIYEDYNRTKTQRWCEYIIFFLTKKQMTLGIMQVSTQKYINDIASIEISVDRIKESQDKFIRNRKDAEGKDYRFGGNGEEEMCLECICNDYNPSQEYEDAIKYMYYTIKAKDEGRELEEINIEQEFSICSEDEEYIDEYIDDDYFDEYEDDDEGNDELNERKCVEIYDIYEFVQNIKKYEIFVVEDDIEFGWLDENINEEKIEFKIQENKVVVLKDLEDIHIEGGEGYFVLENGYTLELKDCEDIVINNLKIVHPENEDDDENEECEDSKGNGCNTMLRLIGCEGVSLRLLDVVSEKNLAIEISNCEDIVIEGIKISNCNSELMIINNSTVYLHNINVKECTTDEEGLIKMNSSIVEIKDSVISNCDCGAYVFSNLNSKLKCENVYVSECKFKEICNQDNIEGIKIV